MQGNWKDVSLSDKALRYGRAGERGDYAPPRPSLLDILAFVPHVHVTTCLVSIV
jgi:hypothetical protein